MTIKKFTDVENHYIQSFFGSTDASEIAKSLGCTVKQLTKQASTLVIQPKDKAVGLAGAEFRKYGDAQEIGSVAMTGGRSKSDDDAAERDNTSSVAFKVKHGDAVAKIF